MSKRAKLHKDYFQQFGTRKGTSKVSDHYVKWLEDQVLELRTEKERLQAAAYEFHNYKTGHSYVDYVERQRMGESDGYTKIPLFLK